MDDAKGPDLSFAAAVTLTPQVAGQLKANKGHIVISTHYYGMPAKGQESKANQFGQVELGVDDADYPLDAKQVRISGHGVDRSQLGAVAGGIVYVWLSTSSFTAVGVRDETVDCSHFRGTIAKAQSAPVSITCGLATGAP
jgi:hypothetical protein